MTPLLFFSVCITTKQTLHGIISVLVRNSKKQKSDPAFSLLRAKNCFFQNQKFCVFCHFCHLHKIQQKQVNLITCLNFNYLITFPVFVNFNFFKSSKLFFILAISFSMFGCGTKVSSVNQTSL